MPASPKSMSRYSSPILFSPTMKLLFTLVVVFFLGCGAGLFFSSFSDHDRSLITHTTSLEQDRIANMNEKDSIHYVRQHKRPFVGHIGSDAGSVSTPTHFILSIEVQFNSDQGLQQFRELFTSMAQWVQSNEPGTISYSMAVSDKDPLQALVFERYIDKDAYLNIHKTSSEFLEFKRKIVEMNDEGVKDRLGWKMTGQSYHHPSGFI